MRLTLDWDRCFKRQRRFLFWKWRDHHDEMPLMETLQPNWIGRWSIKVRCSACGSWFEFQSVDDATMREYLDQFGEQPPGDPFAMASKLRGGVHDPRDTMGTPR
ncbi:MAG: hypothetical protein KC492_13640 [Myxococcales bacterium]|nr:hypothetical protein [Myxococcales bacterium]